MFGIDGKTYPQEGPMTFEGFETYFFTSASTTVIGVIHTTQSSESTTLPSNLEEARGDRTWEECLGGCFYM